MLSNMAASLFLHGQVRTTVTRAKELLIIVGDDQIAYQMIDNVRQSRRYNALRIRIRRDCGMADK